MSTVINLDVERAIRRPPPTLTLDEALASAEEHLWSLHQQLSTTPVVESQAIDEQIATVYGIVHACKEYRRGKQRKQRRHHHRPKSRDRRRDITHTKTEPDQLAGAS